MPWRAEDRLDPLADRREVEAAVRLVPAGGPDDRGEPFDRGGEVPPGVALVADHDLAAGPPGAFEQFEADLTLVALRRGQGEGRWA
jgi:hypothetical protein